MTVEPVSTALTADQSRADAASQRLAAALSAEQAGPAASPDAVERGQAAAETARAELTQANAAIQADQTQAAPVQVPAAASATPATSVVDGVPTVHTLEVVV